MSLHKCFRCELKEALPDFQSEVEREQQGLCEANSSLFFCSPLFIPYPVPLSCMPVSSSNPNSILWPEKYAQDSNIPKTFSNLNLFYCHMIFFFKQWLCLISQFPFISQLIMLYDLTFLLFYLSKELDELPTAKFTDFSALILLDCNNTFLKYASPLASVIHWFLGFLPSPVFLIPFAGVSSVTCCLSFSLCSSSHSVFFLSQLL